MSTWIASMGWQGALNILAIIALVVGIPCSFFIKFTPELAGAKPFGHKEQEEDEAGVQQASTKAVLHSAAFWIVTLLMCVLQFPSVANQMFPTYAAAVGFKATVGGFMVTAAMIFDIFLNPLFGSSADKFGAEKASLGWMTVGLVSLILLVVATNAKAAGLAIFAAGLNDIIYVFLGTGITALAQATFGPRAFAKGFSMVGTVSFVVGAFAMPVNNMIAEKFGGFNAVFIFFGILMVVSMILVMIGSKEHFEEK
ncbi:MFS transporter [Lactobacillus equicursoris]|uniref:MFS transporter n=1 Tax=Lactobacillus equicursoris TaxID=420645 RepID=UPI0018A6C910|nr:MFS transporter [Lactobacillus equicursoris]